ncbi:porin [Arcobacter sp.]|uniref:porin n=1 Tax=unclassified Arcobacter TaxID=2593671 RepID=UPI003B00B8D8
MRANIPKLSLIGALVILSSSASGKNLSEAIENVDVSGTISYRYNDYESDKGAGKTENFYKAALNLSTKVNDDIKVSTRFLAEDFASNTGNEANKNVDVELSEANFTYLGSENLSVTVGKQAIVSPWTISRDSLGDENTGSGIYSVYTTDYVTFSGAYFNQTNFNTADISTWNGITGIDGSENFTMIGVTSSFAGLTLDVAYADLSDTFDTYTVGLAGSYDISGVNISPFARYTSLDLDNSSQDNSLWQLGLSASKGIFSVFAAYGETDKEGGKVSIDSSAKTNMDYAWRVTASNDADAAYTYIGGDVDVTKKVNLGLFYSNADYGSHSRADAKDLTNIFGQVKYKMSKNLVTYVRYGTLETKGEGTGMVGRLNIQYSF